MRIVKQKTEGDFRVMIWIIIAFIICALDQLAKYLVINNVSESTPVTVINGFLYLTHIKNYGAAMGILQDAGIVLIPVTSIVSIIIAYFLLKSKSKILNVSLSFILGGAIGNLIDRIFRGSVTDFLDFHLGPLKFWKYIFNVADIFVVVGTIILAFYLLFIYKEKEKIT
jgi:signal peptidase II